MVLYILMLAAFFAVSIGVGVYCRKKSTDVNGFVLGGRSVGPWLTAFAFGTSYFSAVVFVGYAGQFGWRFGVASTWIGLGNAFLGSLLAWVVLGRRTRLMSQHIDSHTMPDFFGLRFKANSLKTVASLIVFIFLIPYTASLFNGLSRLFAMAFPGVNYAWCVIAMAVLTGIYVIVGGYFATALNDFIQGIIMLFGIVAVIAAALNTKGGLSEAMKSLSTVDNGSGFNGVFTSFFGADPVFLLFVVLLTSFGTWGLPQMVGKFYAIKDENSIKKGAVISTIFAVFVSGGCYFLGSFGRLFAGEISYQADGVTPVYDSIIPKMLENLSPIIIGIVLILVLSASMSTLSSLVLTSASTLTLDLIAPIKKNKLGDSQKMRFIRFFIAVFIVISAVIAILQEKSKTIFIAQLMGVSWGALAGSFLAPFLYGLFWKKTTKASAYVCFFVGSTISLVQLFKGLSGFSFGIEFLDKVFFASSIHSGVFAMAIGMIAVPIVSSFTKKPDSKAVEDMFSCYNKENTVPAKQSLGK